MRRAAAPHDVAVFPTSQRIMKIPSADLCAKWRRRLVRAWWLAALSVATAGPMAQTATRFPSAPIKIVIPFPAGGATDLMARKISDPLAARLGVPVIVENKPGASTAIGNQAVLSAPADGHTLLLSNIALIQAYVLAKKPEYDPLEAFTPVASVSTAISALGVPAALNVKTAREFIDYARKNSGNLSYAITGIGLSSHVNGEELRRRYQFEATPIPYQGDTKATLDLAANRVQFYITTPTGLHPLYKQGAIRILGTTGTQRLTSMPEIPTLTEAGIEGFENSSWFGVLVSAKTPPHIVKILRDEIRQIVRTPEYLKFLDDVKMMPPQDGDFAQEVRDSAARAARMLKQNGIVAP